jgi:hypothetical protein
VAKDQGRRLGTRVRWRSRMLSRTSPVPGQHWLYLLLLCLAIDVASASDITRPEWLPLVPTTAEWSQILEATSRVGNPATQRGASNCEGVGFHSLAEREAARVAAAGDLLRAYVRLCQETAMEARRRAQRLNRSRCCGG